MAVQQLIKRLSISLCLTCISTGLLASPAKLSTVKELMQVSQIDYLLRQSLTELEPYYNKQAEQIILNTTGSQTLNSKEKQAATQLSPLLKESSNQIIANPKTQQVIQDIYLKTYSEEELQASIKFLKTPEGQSITRKNAKMMGELSTYMMQLGQEIFNDDKTRENFQEKMMAIIAPLIVEKNKNQEKP